MKQQNFLDKLESSLSSLDSKEKLDILEDFKQHFKDGLDEGKTEEEIATLLGSPEEIAKQFLPEQEPKVDNTNSSNENSPLAKAMIAFCLIFFNLVFMFGFVGGIFGAVIGLFGGAIGVTATGFTVIIVSVLTFFGLQLLVNGPLLGLALLFLGIGLLTLGILWFIGLIALTKWLCKILGKYIQFNIKLIKGGI